MTVTVPDPKDSMTTLLVPLAAIVRKRLEIIENILWTMSDIHLINFNHIYIYIFIYIYIYIVCIYIYIYIIREFLIIFGTRVSKRPDFVTYPQNGRRALSGDWGLIGMIVQASLLSSHFLGFSLLELAYYHGISRVYIYMHCVYCLYIYIIIDDRSSWLAGTDIRVSQSHDAGQCTAYLIRSKASLLRLNVQSLGFNICSRFQILEKT